MKAQKRKTIQEDLPKLNKGWQQLAMSKCRPETQRKCRLSEEFNSNATLEDIVSSFRREVVKSVKDFL